MALLPSHQSPASSSFSDESPPRESARYDTMASPSASPSQAPAVDHWKYSDEEIRILHEIVTRAEAILSELTPSSRLPTHALFKAYDEILPDYGIDPDDDQHFSKIVFLVGGVKNKESLQDKFRTTMSRLGVTVLEQRLTSGSDAGDAYGNPAHTPDDLSVAGDTADGRFVAGKSPHRESPRVINGKDADSTIDEISDDYTALEDRDDRRLDGVNSDVSIGNSPVNLSRVEQALESSAIAFRKKHHNKFSAVATLRHWHQRSNFISNLCGQFDTARQADLEEDVETKFEAWRAIAAGVEEMPPQTLPPNVYSKRIEGIAVRAHEIHATKTSLRRWRLCARGQNRKLQQAEESLDPFERIAAKAHKNLMLSRAFVNWSNRLEEESEKAQMAAKVYEINLKSRTFGLHHHPGGIARTRDIPPGVHFGAPPTDPAGSGEEVPNVGAGGDNMQSDVASIDHAGLSVVPVRTRKGIAPEIPSGSNLPSYDNSGNSDGEADEKTLLARRHILRMRYYDAWERYTADSLGKVRDFEAEQREQRIAHIVPIWRSRSEQSSHEQETLRHNAERISYYNDTGRVFHAWRQGSQGKMQEQEDIQENYAARANFYYKATRILPILRSETGQTTKQKELLNLYASRAEFYYATTKALPVWRIQAQQDAEREEQTLVRYAQRADYYYRTRSTLLTWRSLAKQRRKQRLKDAHLETRRIVKRGMGQRCIAQWREKLHPSLEQSEVLNAILEDVVADREWRQSIEVLDTWREVARQRNEMSVMSDTMVKHKALKRWRGRSKYHQVLRTEAEEHWNQVALSRTLKTWNLRSLQKSNRPAMVANALEKRGRKLLRAEFEGWYSRTADKLVPVELPDGGYKSVDQVVEDAQRHASLNQARGLFSDWRAAAATNKGESAQEEVYAPTPGRPRIFLGVLGRGGTTTPLAPVPSRAWRASETAMRAAPGTGARASRSGRTGRNLRVSWAQ
ncbi:hypothetical protein AAE478_006302 [Parahypoxylon ruwenzoriense]